MAAPVPAELQVTDGGDGRFRVPHPTDDPEARDVVFSGQILAQMIMVSDHAVGSAKDVKSVHAIFARAGTYSAGPMDYQLDQLHSGRAWGSDTITVTQGDRLLSRGLVLLNTIEADLMRHGPTMPDVPEPDALAPSAAITFPGVETRNVDAPDATAPDGSPAMYSWIRSDASYDSVAVNQAVLSWCQPGAIIGLAMRPHRDTVNIVRRAPDHLDGCDLAHVSLRRPLRRRRLAAHRATGDPCRERAGLRERHGLHERRHAGVHVRPGQHGARRRCAARSVAVDVARS